jgi:hypothetical protein
MVRERRGRADDGCDLTGHALELLLVVVFRSR